MQASYALSILIEISSSERERFLKGEKLEAPFCLKGSQESSGRMAYLDRGYTRDESGVDFRFQPPDPYDLGFIRILQVTFDSEHAPQLSANQPFRCDVKLRNREYPVEIRVSE